MTNATQAQRSIVASVAALVLAAAVASGAGGARKPTPSERAAITVAAIEGVPHVQGLVAFFMVRSIVTSTVKPGSNSSFSRFAAVFGVAKDQSGLYPDRSAHRTRRAAPADAELDHGRLRGKAGHLSRTPELLRRPPGGHTARPRHSVSVARPGQPLAMRKRTWAWGWAVKNVCSHGELDNAQPALRASRLMRRGLRWAAITECRSFWRTNANPDGDRDDPPG